MMYFFSVLDNSGPPIKQSLCLETNHYEWGFIVLNLSEAANILYTLPKNSKNRRITYYTQNNNGNAKYYLHIERVVIDEQNIQQKIFNNLLFLENSKFFPDFREACSILKVLRSANLARISLENSLKEHNFF